MPRFEKGDRVRIDIPDVTDIDHEEYHGRRGEVVRVIEDEVSEITGDDRDNLIFRVILDEGETVDFRRRDLRPP